MKKTVMITGADRGLGFAIVKEYLTKGYRVFAGQYMQDWKELEEAKEEYPDTLYLVPLDVSDTQSVKAAFEIVSKETESLDVLINNAGIASKAGDIFTVNNTEMGATVFNANCLGAMRMVHTFLPLMERDKSAKRLCFVSSESGCISVCHRTDGFLYPMSKTALNMAVRLLFEELHPQGYSFRMFHPGWVKSYMTGKKSDHGKFEPEESAKSAITYFENDVINEDVLHIVDNEFVVWPF